MAMQFWILLGKSWELCEDIVKVVHTLDHQQDWRYCDFSLSLKIYIFNREQGKNIYVYEAKINKYVMLHSGRKFCCPSSHAVFVQMRSLFLTNTRTLLTMGCEHFPIQNSLWCCSNGPLLSQLSTKINKSLNKHTECDNFL